MAYRIYIFKVIFIVAFFLPIVNQSIAQINENISHPGTIIPAAQSKHLNASDINDSVILNSDDVSPLAVKTQVIEKAKCHDDNVKLKAVATGGQPPYSYKWSNGYKNPELSTDSSGIYYVTVTDNKKDHVKASVIARKPKAFKIKSLIGDIECAGNDDGFITIEVKGGTGGYQYAWSTGETTASLNDIKGGEYTVIVTDENGCYTKKSFYVEEPDSITVSYNIDQPYCPEVADGSIYLTADGGSLSYNYTWSNGYNSYYIENLSEGVYTVTVSDINDCKHIKTITLSAKNRACINPPNAFSPNDDGTNDTWEIKNIENYPGASFEIYNKWGELIYKCEGDCESWNGKFRGKPLPVDSYHYFIYLNNGQKPIVGSVTIIK